MSDDVQTLIRRARDFGKLKARGVSALPWTITDLTDDFDVAHAVGFDAGFAKVVVELDEDALAAIAGAYRSALATG